jgi:ATPase subunit of ABC transporter with duplicated ATPase domains
LTAFLTLSGLACRTPDGRELFSNLDLAIGAERIGLVGRNGVGKTSLLRIILGELAPAAGTLAINGRIGTLNQAPPAAGATLADLLGVREALARLDRIERGEGAAADFDLADWDLPQRIEAAMAEMGLAGAGLDRPAISLSGGEATRAGLAALLIDQPDLILLDEPTNNLDAEAREIVGQMLERWRGGALVVSHDRALLRGMDRIVELTSLGATNFGGGYDLYAERKAAMEQAAARDLDNAEQEVRRAQAELQRERERKAKRDAAGKRSRAKGDAPKMLLDAQAERAEVTGARLTRIADRRNAVVTETLEAAQAKIERVRRLAFALPPSRLPAARRVLSLEGVGYAVNGRWIVRGFSLTLTGPERIAITGPNGAGKTTLIRLMVGEIEPSQGRVVRGVPLAVLDQRASILDPNQTLAANFLRLNPDANRNAAQAALAKFLFRNTAADALVGALSGGETLRAALACVLMSTTPPQCLILDEPTNHLDLDSIAAIEQALLGYDGSLIVVSHDEDFLEAVGIERRVVLGHAVSGERL